MNMTKPEISMRLDIGQDFVFLDTFKLEHNIGFKTDVLAINRSPLAVGGSATITFDIDDTRLKAHFLSKRVVPGTLILESILQTMAMSIYTTFKSPPMTHSMVVSVNMNLTQSLSPGVFCNVFSKIDLERGGVITGEGRLTSDAGTICTASLKYFSSELFPKVKSQK